MTTQTRWQYQVLDFPVKVFEGGAKNAQRIQDELNRQGQLGWELVSLIAITAMTPARATFKRAV
jgi:hypothetical protein